jgi:tetratricopeptide (TPR) repeat protein
VELISEHRMYSASCGLFLLAGALAAGLGERWRAPTEAPRLRRWGIPAAAGAVLLALFTLTVARNRVWSSNVSLWRDATEKAPLTWAPHYALADALRLENRCADAIPVYRRALELLPRDVSTLVNLGICEAREGDLGSARVRFETALSLDPSALRAADNLARVEMLAGNDALARQLLEKILRIDPRDTVALVALAELAAKSGDTATVELLCAQAREVAPQAEGVATCGQPGRVR